MPPTNNPTGPDSGKANPPPLLCLGLACYDLIFTVDEHPGPDEKMVARSFLGCGGGTAANGAVAAARLQHPVLFAGYLGQDAFGDQHLAEMAEAGVDTRLVARGSQPTAISSIYVKPDGQRSIVNYRRESGVVDTPHIDLVEIGVGAVLLDGHSPRLARQVADAAAARGIPTVLDADGVHAGSLELASRVTYLVASERFALIHSGAEDIQTALARLASPTQTVVITLGERGLVWARDGVQGALPAFAVDAVDTTGAGDAFHGAFAAGVAAGYAWDYLLTYASAVGALCTTVIGARPGIPTRQQVMAFLEKQEATIHREKKDA